MGAGQGRGPADITGRMWTYWGGMHGTSVHGTETSPNRAQPCGSLLPNDLGMFDMLGNVYEWCQERALVQTAFNRNNK